MPWAETVNVFFLKYPSHFSEAGGQMGDFKEHKIFCVYFFAQEFETVLLTGKWPYDKSSNFGSNLSKLFSPYHNKNGKKRHEVFECFHIIIVQSLIIYWVRGPDVYITGTSAQFGSGTDGDNPSWVSLNPDLGLSTWFSAESSCRHQIMFTEVLTWSAWRSCPGQSCVGKQLHCNDTQVNISSLLASFIFSDVAVLHGEEQCASGNTFSQSVVGKVVISW